jgi:D-alanyl-D-alanine carboxypeptidase
MNPRFQAVCEAAALDVSVPALAAGGLVGERTWATALGCDTATRFHVASVTKPATALLALTLLDPDAPTGIWPDDVRVRHLLSHTTGFESELGDLGRFGEGEDALARLAAELPSARRPVGLAEAWSYANTGYWLAGHLAARRADEPYEDAVERLVLRPAGLHETSFAAPDLQGSGPGATGDPYPRARRPSGGLVSTVPDLLALGLYLLSSPLGAAMRTPVAATPGGVYGLGLHGERVNGVEVWGHGGSWGGFQSSLLLVPERDAVFAGLTSSGRGSLALRRIEDVWLESVTGGPRPVAPTVPLAPDALAGFEGAYATTEQRFEVEAQDGGLRLSDETGSFRARPIGERCFELVEGDAAGSRFDFPLPRFGRFGSRLAERVA